MHLKDKFLRVGTIMEGFLEELDLELCLEV